MRIGQITESAMDDTIRIMQKTFSDERRAVQDQVLKLARAVEMGEGDKMELARAITDLTKSELEVKRSDPDLSISAEQNIKVLKASMAKLTGQTESVGEISEITEGDVIKILRSKKPTYKLRNRAYLDKLPDTKKPTVKQIELPAQLDLFKDDVQRIDSLLEKNEPTDPAKWSYYKSQAKEKFEVYPSAYANAWAAKKYKAAGGGWRSK